MTGQESPGGSQEASPEQAEGKSAPSSDALTPLLTFFSVLLAPLRKAIEKPASVFPFLEWLPKLDRKTLWSDTVAGFTNATVVLPQGVAFATVAGLPPIYGLYTAMIPPILAALFGSSMVMISGPTMAISAVVFSALSGRYEPGSPEFIQAALLLTLLVGIIQLLLGLAKLGRLVGFVSHSVMVGFTAAAALLIGIGQIDEFFGLQIPGGGTVVERILHLGEALPEFNLYAVAIALVSLCSLVLFRLFAPKLPGFLLALIIGSVFAWAIGAQEQGVAMIGGLPSVVPSFEAPELNFDRTMALIESAMAIALIALLEAIAISRAFAMRMQTPFDANREIVGQGLSNTVGGFFQCYPASGSFTRSGLNYEAGARTPFSAIVSSVALLALLLFVAPLVAHVPIPAMAGIIVYVAYRLIDVKELSHIIRTSRTEITIVLATFFAGILVELEFAIYIGVILSLLMFLNKSARPTLAISAPDRSDGSGTFRNAQAFGLPECPQVVFVRLDGLLYFGSVDAIERAFRRLETERPEQKHVVLILKGVGDIDLAGADLIVNEFKRRQARGGRFYIVARYPPFVEQLEKLGVIDRCGADNLIDNKGVAVRRMLTHLDMDRCAVCPHRVFKECDGLPNVMRETAATPEADDFELTLPVDPGLAPDPELGDRPTPFPQKKQATGAE